MHLLVRPVGALLLLVSGCVPGSLKVGEDSEAASESDTGGSDSAITGGSTGADSSTGELACAEEPAFTASLDAWNAAVQANGATYFYTVLRGSQSFDLPDFCVHRTLVAVADGVVVERRFEFVEQVGEIECDAPFVEVGAEIGTHTPNLAAVPATVDALYAGCCDMVIHKQPADEVTYTFEVDDAGLMRTCFYVANSCVDSCDSGPLGTSLTFEQLSFGAPPPAP